MLAAGKERTPCHRSQSNLQHSLELAIEVQHW